ncbi:chromate resistance protein ChrB domain-containing protein [Pacificoceanicola onchidii]|uniref:chromate resistance protein ChrB domain-containing protein n=1 Tax=Pacificoceanicola onchidii TaxID=2562685 RepID=UPI0010A3EF1F|nr:chromate resistance protein ChrB domain-containing protein [Pacificoceanicola onchidii]
MPAPNEITAPQLLRKIGLPDCPVLIDVGIPEDVAQNPVRLPTALRHAHGALESLPERLGGRPAVVICQKGLKLSQGVAAWLRAQGHRAEYLGGGMAEWQAQDGPVVAESALPQSTLWITRHRPRIDRIACPWLIRRFVDPAAQVLYVAPSEVTEAARRLNAIPFDVPEVALTHTGDHCSFDAMLARFGLRYTPLARMADVIRAADSGRPEDHPVAVGLLAVSIGLSRQYADDNALCEAGLPLYDALFRWARDGYTETHDACAQRAGGFARA